MPQILFGMISLFRIFGTMFLLCMVLNDVYGVGEGVFFEGNSLSKHPVFLLLYLADIVMLGAGNVLLRLRLPSKMKGDDSFGRQWIRGLPGISHFLTSYVGSLLKAGESHRLGDIYIHLVQHSSIFVEAQFLTMVRFKEFDKALEFARRHVPGFALTGLVESSVPLASSALPPESKPKKVRLRVPRQPLLPMNQPMNRGRDTLAEERAKSQAVLDNQLRTEAGCYGAAVAEQVDQLLKQSNRHAAEMCILSARCLQGWRKEAQEMGIAEEIETLISAGRECDVPVLLARTSERRSCEATVARLRDQASLLPAHLQASRGLPELINALALAAPGRPFRKAQHLVEQALNQE